MNTKATVLYAKANLTVSGASESYPGSITLGPDIFDELKILPYQMCQVCNIENGARIVTYAITGNANGMCELNGAASKHFSQGDRVHINFYAHVDLPDFDEPKILGKHSE